jgi:AcrR family transcriptional regulator
MSTVSTSYEETGRSQQKQRTRAALVASARQLISRTGSIPTVADTAVAAGISRTSAYRYFPSQQALLIAAHPEVEATTMLSGVTDDSDVPARVEAVLRRYLAVIIDTEPQQRTMLRLSLTDSVDQSGLALRQGRAIGWLSEALRPWNEKLGEDGVRRLAIAIRAASGIESFVWLTDVAGLDKPAAVELIVWSVSAMVRSAEVAVPPDPRPSGQQH